ncbi:MAG: hypothetical protein H7Y31_02630 [Chitinophagaceae bacterium]|nr:hypothetical protein [Chitinophagaceae bacterium]
MKTQLFNIISTLAIIAAFVPFLLVSVKKLWGEKAFLLIACYWMLNGIVNILSKIDSISTATLDLVTIVYNMLDIPLVLIVIHFASNNTTIKRFTKIGAPIMLIAQLLSFVTKGWNYDSAKYILAVGLLLVMILVVWEIALYMQKLQHSKNEKAMIFIHVSLLFAYGTFIIIYIFDYYINLSSSIDNFIIYYISTLVAVIIASIGYLAKASTRNFI